MNLLLLARFALDLLDMTVYCATRFEIGNFVPRQTIGLKK